MNCGSNQPLRGVARELSIGIQSDHVANLAQQIFVGRGDDETGIRRTAQQAIELAQLAAFSFPTNPLVFRLAPLTATVKQVKSNWLAIAVSPI